MDIPLQIPKQNVNFDIPFDINQQETGESKILDYPNKKVQHRIKFIDPYSSINSFFNFNSLEYVGSWIFHLISIQPLEGIVIVQVSNQSKQSQSGFHKLNKIEKQFKEAEDIQMAKIQIYLEDCYQNQYFCQASCTLKYHFYKFRERIKLVRNLTINSRS